MSEKTSAEIVAEMQRKLDRVETALYHLCHLKKRVAFRTQRRDGNILFAAYIHGVHEESVDQDEVADPVALLTAIGNRAFEAHIIDCEERANAQR